MPSAPTPNLQAEIAFYSQRLIYQYASKPKARAVISILAYAALMGDLVTLLRDGFTLDTAVGPQLDILGKYIGLGRNIGPGAALDYFGLRDSVLTNPQNNYGLRDSTVDASNANVLIWDAQGNVGQTTTLADPQYRVALKLKILQNMTDGTLSGVQSGLMRFFGVPGFTCMTPGNASLLAISTALGQVTACFAAPTGGGYTVGRGPYVLFVGGGGSGALAQMPVNSAGRISGNGRMIAGGSGYATIPTPVYCGCPISLTDNLNMTCTYLISQTIPIALSVLQKLLPRTMGVAATVTIV